MWRSISRNRKVVDRKVACGFNGLRRAISKLTPPDTTLHHPTPPNTTRHHLTPPDTTSIPHRIPLLNRNRKAVDCKATCGFQGLRRAISKLTPPDTTRHHPTPLDTTCIPLRIRKRIR